MNQNQHKQDSIFKPLGVRKKKTIHKNKTSRQNDGKHTQPNCPKQSYLTTSGYNTGLNKTVTVISVCNVSEHKNKDS